MKALPVLKVLILLCLAETVAFADESQSLGRTTVEVQPFLLLSNGAPRTKAFTLGVERSVSQHYAGFLDGWTYANEASESSLSEDVSRHRDRLYSRSVAMESLDLGLRYYQDIAQDSFYAGIFGEYRNTRQTFHMGEERLKVHASRLALGLEIGYRWLFSNGATIRLGARYLLPIYQNFGGDGGSGGDAQESIREVKRWGTYPAATLDLALGYNF